MGVAAALDLGRSAAADSPFTVDAWSTADGLPQSSVIAIAQTHDGYLWLGTINGLVRFDGNSMTPVNVNNAPGLPDNFIISLFADSRSNLWIGTANGRLCAVQDGTIKQFDVSAAGGKIVLADEEAPGVVGFLTSGPRFFTITGDRLNVQTSGVPGKYFYRYYHVVLFGRNGVIWQMKGGHVLKSRNGQAGSEVDLGPTPWTPALCPFPGGDTLRYLYDANVTAFCEDQEGNLGDALRWYQTYLTDVPDDGFRAEAMGRRMTATLRVSGAAQARDLAAEYLRHYPQGAYAKAARAILSQ